MASKEYVYELTLDEALQKLDITLYDRNCDIRVIKARQQLIDVIRKETKKLKQDSEILDILKETIKSNMFDVEMLEDRENGDTVLSCEDYGITLKTEEYYKIKGWVNNGK